MGRSFVPLEAASDIERGRPTWPPADLPRYTAECRWRILQTRPARDRPEAPYRAASAIRRLLQPARYATY